MNAEDWKNRCDSYRELSTRLGEKCEAMKALLKEIHDTSDSVSLKFKIMEVLK